MKVSVNLINSYLKNHLNSEVMAEVLERTEVEVEEILYSIKLDYRIITAQIVSESKHPNAETLRLVKVQTDGGEVDIVCGADNVRPGLVVALAQIGSVLPDGNVIKEAKIRGEISHGMLCSAFELGMGNDRNGIIELDPTLPIGRSLCDIAIISDILDIKTPSNRWDYMSYIGLAREIAAMDADNALVEPNIADRAYNNTELLNVNLQGECDALLLLKARVKVDAPSPKWLVDNLLSSGIRTINPVVDITNFVMLEYGQPSHAYDARSISGNIKIRFASKGESLTTLDGKAIKLSGEDLVVADDSGAIGLAGIMGGQKTETKPNTIEIVVEVANFNKTTVRRSALRHGLRTEASARFEKGLPGTLPHLAMRRIAGLLKEICQADIANSPALQANDKDEVTYLGLRIRKAEKFLGYKLAEKEVALLLSKRGFRPTHFSLTRELKDLQGSNYTKATTTPKIYNGLNSAQTLYLKAGLDIGSSAVKIYGTSMEVPDIGLKPGDLLFLGHQPSGNKPNNITDIGIYAGKNKVISSSHLSLTSYAKATDGLEASAKYSKPSIQSQTGKPQLVPVTKYTKSNNYLGARRYLDNFNHILSVQIPWWRADIVSEVDLFEEVAKAIGYGHMPETLPLISPSLPDCHNLLTSLMSLRFKLSAYGLIEIMTYSFVSKKEILKVSPNTNKYLQIENPLSSEQDYLRTNLLTSHLRAIAKNQSSNSSALFEISRVYEKINDGVVEKWVLGVSIWGEDSLLRLKGVLDVLLGWYRLELNLTRLTTNPSYITSRAGRLEEGLGEYGQLSPAILGQFDINKEVSYGEFDIGTIVESEQNIVAIPAKAYQIITKDITVELPSSGMYGDLRTTLAKHAHSIRFKGEYQNDQLHNQDRKRITITVNFDLGPNPSSEEISLRLNKCVMALAKLPKAQVL